MGLLHGVTDSASYTAQAAFGLGEGVYMIAAGPAYDTITNAVSVKVSSGLDSSAVKLMFGDWLWWNDDTNGMMLVRPQAFAGGISLFHIAARELGDACQWWRVAEVNGLPDGVTET
ncbi:phage tail sheath protein [Gluconobacter morbifer G707]|uniref:Phage tail sheath protein n=1 Tax=Gluconobacter morbifer G707 TaxID=1088869 RepID=G6XMB5_9PROT|nr:phage tail sheath protein [Gluconobacter morbifer G707]